MASDEELTPNEILRLVAENKFDPMGPNDRCYIPDVGPDALIAYSLDEKYVIVVDHGVVSVAENNDYGTTSWGVMVEGSENYRKIYEKIRKEEA